MPIENIKVSIIIPMFNAEEYLEEAIESALSQTLDDLEIIMVDDLSTDNTLVIASRYAKQNNKIKLIKLSENKGVSTARNVGMDIAGGEFIFFLDSDDMIPPNAIEIMYKAAVEQNVNIVSGIYERFDSKGRTLINFFNQFPNLQEQGPINIFETPELFYSVYCWGKLLRHEFIKNVRFVEEISFAEDHIFTAEIFLKSKTIYNVNSIVYHYRTREKQTESVTQNIYKDPANNLTQLINAIDQVQKKFCESINERSRMLKIFGVYLTRVIHWNVWSSLISGLLSLNISEREKVVNLYNNWLIHLDKSIIISNLDDFKVLNYKIRKIWDVMDEKTIILSKKTIEIIDNVEKNKGEHILYDR